MRIVVIRDVFTPDSTSSRACIPGTSYGFFMLERPRFVNGEQNVNGLTCILPGVYPISLYWSAHNKLWVPLLMGVPGRSLIEIHPANKPGELLGCLAPGLVRAQDSVLDSRKAFFEMMRGLYDAMFREEPIDIEITEVRP